MSYVLFEIIVPAEKEDLQDDIEERQQKSGDSGSDTDEEGDTDGDGDCRFSDEYEEWNTSEDESKNNSPSKDTDKEISGQETEDSKKNDKNNVSSQAGNETGRKSNNDNVKQDTKAGVKKKSFTVNKVDEHSHEPLDVTENQQPKETGENNPLPNDKKSEENCVSGKKDTGNQQQSNVAKDQAKNNEKTASVSGEKPTPNQKQNEKDATNQEKTGENKSQEKTNQDKIDVKKTSDEKGEGIKQSQRRSKRKKKKESFSVKTVNKDVPKSNKVSDFTNKKSTGKIPDFGQNKNDEKNDESKTESVKKSDDEEQKTENNIETDQSQGKNKLLRKVQFKSLKQQKSYKKSGNTTEENSGCNSTEISGNNSNENSGENSGYMSDDNSGYSTDGKSIGSRTTPKYDHQYSMVEFIPEQISTLLESVKETISYLDIKNAVIIMTDNQLSYKISFVEESGSRCEIILKFLKSCGVGRKDKSSISVIPVSIYYDIDTDTKNNEELKDSSSGEDVVKDDEFKKSVKARLVVDQVVQSVKTNAALTFDYLVLTFLASLIAAVGLIESSSVVLVASMLISPLMGPILAIVFGSVIKNPTLWKLGLKNELIGLGVCISCGFVFGLLPAGLTMLGTKWRITEEFPTIEMSSRGTPRSLGVGMLIAIPSGAGVALSVLGGNMGSLVGVAISASLLPPAVNAGMLWAYSIMTAIVPPRTIPTQSLGNLTDDLCDHFEYIDNTYQPSFFCDMWKEAAMLGFISLVLTVLNIGAILLMGCLVLKVKEVVPLKEKDTFTEFFHNDIKIARKSYQTHKNYESRALFERFRSRQNSQPVTKDEDNKDKSTLYPNNVKMVSRKKIMSIAQEEGVQAITQRLNRPFSYNYNLSEKSLKSLVPEETFTVGKESTIEEESTQSGSGRKFEVVTYPDEISKDQLKEDEPKATDEEDPSVQRELQQLDEILKKPASVSMEDIQMQVLNKDLAAERDENIEVEEEVQLKLADLFVNPKDSFSQNPPTLKNSEDIADTNKSDCDTNENSQEAKCDTDSEGEVSKPLLNLKV